MGNRRQSHDSTVGEDSDSAETNKDPVVSANVSNMGEQEAVEDSDTQSQPEVPEVLLDVILASRPKSESRFLTFLSILPILVPLLVLLCCLSIKQLPAQVVSEELLMPKTPARFDKPSWEVRPVESDEDEYSPAFGIAKKGLAKVVKGYELKPPAQSHAEAQVMAELAKALSGKSTEDLIGMKISLTNRRKAGSRGVEDGSQAFVVTRFLREDYSSAFLEVKDEETLKTYAMRVQMLSPNNYPAFDSAQSEARAIIQRSLQGELQACDGMSPSEAASNKGIAVTQMVASIEGLPPVISGENVSFLSTVEVIEGPSFSLDSFLTFQKDYYTGYKAYIARSVLRTVLQLQHAGLSHNQINSAHFWFRSDGSLVLTGFESSVPFEEFIPPETFFPVITTDPSLISAMTIDDLTLKADPSSDMWSLGVLLYEIMMEGKLPYNLGHLVDESDPFAYVANLRPHVDDVRKDLEDAGINLRWRELICGLLDPNKETRIRAEGIVYSFQDVLKNELELEIFDVGTDRQENKRDSDSDSSDPHDDDTKPGDVQGGLADASLPPDASGASDGLADTGSTSANAPSTPVRAMTSPMSPLFDDAFVPSFSLPGGPSQSRFDLAYDGQQPPISPNDIDVTTSPQAQEYSRYVSANSKREVGGRSVHAASGRTGSLLSPVGSPDVSEANIPHPSGLPSPSPQLGTSSAAYSRFETPDNRQPPTPRNRPVVYSRFLGETEKNTQNSTSKNSNPTDETD